MKNKKCLFEFIIIKNQWFISTLVWNILLVLSVIHWFKIDICPHSACHLSRVSGPQKQNKKVPQIQLHFIEKEDISFSIIPAYQPIGARVALSPSKMSQMFEIHVQKNYSDLVWNALSYVNSTQKFHMVTGKWLENYLTIKNAADVWNSCSEKLFRSALVWNLLLFVNSTYSSFTQLVPIY